MKHTPGPWKVAEDKSQHPTHIRVLDQAHNGICTSWLDDYDFEENQTAEANANLIAAAPEMLEALELVQSSYCLQVSSSQETPEMKRARTLVGYVLNKVKRVDTCELCGEDASKCYCFSCGGNCSGRVNKGKTK
jgi:hypothetical protein